MITIADVLADIKRQLDWRGPTEKPQGHIVLSREMAEYLHTTMLAIIVERDALVFEKERGGNAPQGTVPTGV